MTSARATDRWLIIFPLWMMTVGGCGGAQSNATARAADINQVLDDWHNAAAAADATRYFGHMADSSVFIGTDATERWDKAAFERFARPYFARGKAWTMTPTRRHVQVARDGAVAWFDEQLRHAKYGAVRGSGTLVSQGGRWRIAHYVLSFPVPNAVSGQVIALIRAHKPPAPSPSTTEGARGDGPPKH